MTITNSNVCKKNFFQPKHPIYDATTNKNECKKCAVKNKMYLLGINQFEPIFFKMKIEEQ